MSLSPRPAVLIADRYAVREKLGSGSMGSVYRCFDTERKRTIALKLLRAGDLSSELVERMRSEFLAIRTLRHPQIATAYDFGYTETGAPFYTRESIDGCPIEPGSARSVAAEEHLAPIVDVIDAVAYLHDHDILHLDIHAGNCIVASSPGRGCVLIDFGLPRSLGELHVSSGDSTWANLPPELRAGEPCDARTDVYMIGRLLQQRVGGEGRIGGEALDEPRLPREIPGWGGRTTLGLERILQRCLQPSPAQRFASVRELRTALLSILGAEDDARTSRSDPQDVLCGREKEVARLEDIVRAASRGETRAMVLHGERGVGKSRLLCELRTVAQLRGLPVAHVDFTSPSGAEPGLRRALQRSGAGTAWLGALSPKHGGTPHERARRAVESFQATDGPALVVLIDRVDAADPDSAVLIDAFAERCASEQDPSRSARGLAFVSVLSSSPETRRLPAMRLQPLGRTAAKKLLVSLAGDRTLPEPILRELASASRGLPRLVERTARQLRDGLELRAVREAAARADRTDGRPAITVPLGADETSVLVALLVAGRPLSRVEVSAAVDRPARLVRMILAELRASGLVVTTGRSAAYAYRLTDEDATAEALGDPTPRQSRRIHRRLADHLAARPSPACGEHVARHLLRAGQIARGRTAALRATEKLCASQAFDRAVDLLGEFLAEEGPLTHRVKLAKTMSRILDAHGDHERGIVTIERVFAESDPSLPDRDRVALLRRLGIHYHRAGRPDEARRAFERVTEIARLPRDLEDVVLVESELAEIHLFSGDYASAEDACRRGLERLQERSIDTAVRGRMQAVLHASLGHVALRRMDSDRATRELETAWRLGLRHATTAERAAILHNLAAASNLRCEFEAARSAFLKAERLVERAGDWRGLAKVSTNLAVLAAKLGRANEAEDRIARAEELSRQFANPRLEFFVEYSRGLVELLLGRGRSAATALTRCLPLGRELGDTYLVGFAEVYLAEAHLLCARYDEALDRLRAAAETSRDEDDPIRDRMVHSRWYLLATLLGNASDRERSMRILERRTRRDARDSASGNTSRVDAYELLDAWNTLFVIAGDLLGATQDAMAADLESKARAAGEIFERCEVPFGARAAAVLRVCTGRARNERAATHEALKVLDREPRGPHAFIAIAEAVVRADVELWLDRPETAEIWLGRAGGEIVGHEAIDLDGAIELLRARLALRKGRIEEARRNLQRSSHALDLLEHRVPARARKPLPRPPSFREPTRLGGATTILSAAPNEHEGAMEIRSVRGTRRSFASDDRCVPNDREAAVARASRLDRRRHGHRQGARRARDLSTEPPPRKALRGRALRLASGCPLRVGDLRARGGCVLRSRDGPHRTLAARRRRNGSLRRGRRVEPGGPNEAPSNDRVEPHEATRRGAIDLDRREVRLLDERGPRRTRGGRNVSRRSLLPNRRGGHSRPAAPGTTRGHSRARPPPARGPRLRARS